MGVDVTAVGVGVGVATAAERLAVAVGVAAGTVLVDVGTVATGVGVTGGNTTVEVSDPHPAPRPPSTIAPINTATLRCIVDINRSVKPCRFAVATEAGQVPAFSVGPAKSQNAAAPAGARSGAARVADAGRRCAGASCGGWTLLRGHFLDKPVQMPR